MVKVMTEKQRAEGEDAVVTEETPAAEVVEEQTSDMEEVASTDEDWDDLLGDDEEDGFSDDEEVAETEEEPETEVEETPEDTEEETPAEDAAEEEEPETEEVPAVEEEETETPPEVSEEERKAAIADAREKARESLRESFQLTEEQESQITTDPNKVIPDLMAKLYMDVFDSIMGGMQQSMPQMIQKVNTVEANKQKARDAFYSAWPKLNNPKYAKTIDRISESYGKANQGRKIDPATAIREIGAQAWIALQLPIEEMGLQTDTQEIIETPAPSGRAPASSAGGPRAAAAPVTSMNEFESMSQEFIDEES